jgi:hypothetical protein
MKRFAAILLLTVTVFSVAAPAWGGDGERMSQICQSDSDCDDDCCSRSDRGDACCCSGLCPAQSPDCVSLEASPQGLKTSGLKDFQSLEGNITQ